MRQKLCFVGGHVHVYRAVVFTSLAGEAEIESLLHVVIMPAVFADRFTDWKDVLYGLVAKTRGVSEKHLTRERVEQGCVIFHELYELRRSARRRHVH